MTYDDMLWLRLGRVAPSELAQTRLTLHWLAQIFAAAGTALIEKTADDSHTNLLWDPEHGGFTGRALPNGHRLFLDIRWFRGSLRDADGKSVGSLELEGQTLRGFFDWMQDTLTSAGYTLPEGGLQLPEYEMPEHPVGKGEPLVKPDVQASREFARWYHDATMVLNRVAAAQEGSSQVRGWPHHFDLATLITLDADKGHEEARSIGVGLSPGDTTLAMPYFYVTPWPYPASDAALADLPSGGYWHREGWTGALLSAETIAAIASSKEQLQAVESFLNAAIEAARAALGG